MLPSIRRTVTSTIGLALALSAFACFSSERIMVPHAKVIKVSADAMHDDISDINGYIRACKKGGPAGTYHFHLDVQGGGDLVMLDQDLTIPFDGVNIYCRTMMYPINPETWVGVSATATVTEVQIPDGMQVDSIQFYSTSGNGAGPTVFNTASVSTPFTFGDMFWYKYFNGVAQTPTCADPSATNFGGPLPCVYPPPPPTPCPAGSFTYSFDVNGDLLIKYDQFPAPNDNSYGVNSVGWGKKVHRFTDLVGSDHAGFQLRDGSGTVRLSFNVDYISANSSAPSGYASLGVTGGDGSMLVGTASGITATTSLANNLNNINIPGLFNPATHTQQFGSVNLFVDSPPTDPLHQTYDVSDPTLAGWDFHNTYYVKISAAKLASIGFDPASWKVEPNADQLHNSPAKPCPTASGGVCAMSVTKFEVSGKQVKVTVLNGAATDAFLTGVALTWPSAVNGKLVQVKLDGDVVYDTPDLSGGSMSLTQVNLVASAAKRKVNHGSSDVLTFIFANDADKDLAHYTGSALFGDCIIGNLFTMTPP